MAAIAKRKVRLEIEWSNTDPSNFRYRTVVWGYIDDDSKMSGEEECILPSEFQTIARSAFRALTGQQIENNAVALANAALQDMGSGAGTHIITDELGNGE
jgi:hypothetical protein